MSFGVHRLHWRLGAGLLMAGGCWQESGRPECWSLGRMLAGAANVQILSSAKDFKEFWPNVGMLVCWSFRVFVFVKKGVRKKESPKGPTYQHRYIYISISLMGATFLNVGR